MVWFELDALDKSLWQIPDQAQFLLSGNDVDIWAFSHEHDEEVAQNLISLLNDTECNRATKFYNERLQNRYIVRHAVLRKILAFYAGNSAKSLEFTLGQNGKPALKNTEIFFNLSHSHEMVVIAVSKNLLIGIDVEYSQPISDMGLVAQHHFSEYEQQQLFALPESEQMAAFYRIWSRKEAYIKSDGRGLQVPLAGFDVSVGDLPQVLRTDNNTDAALWSVQNLPFSEKYIGAMMVYGEIGAMRFLRPSPIFF